MEQLKAFENYPWWIILVSNFISLAIYAIGAYIIFQVGIVWFVIYLVYIIGLEIRLLKTRCVYCYYYGKFCAFGKGKLSSILFKKGESHKFLIDNLSWKDILPDVLVSIIPLIVGIVLLIMKFDWLILTLLVILILFTTVGSGFVRGSLACKYCKQKEMGCPSEQLFDKSKK